MKRRGGRFQAPAPDYPCEEDDVTDNRATGWKIPLLFCGVILSIVAVAALFRAHAPEPPAVPQALLKEAKGIRIDLESDPEGQSWKARIASAASGFSTQADKDGRLGEIVLTTAENKRFDASCTAAVLIRDDRASGRADAENRQTRRLPTAHRSRGASSPCTECATRKHKRKPPPCSRNAGKNAMKEGNS